LHDRLIFIDGAQVWLASQSFNALAARSPASIIEIDADTAQLKFDAYEALWSTATVIV
jgi:hypothetical protein